MSLVKRMSLSGFVAALAMVLGPTAASEAGAEGGRPASTSSMPVLATGSVAATYALAGGEQASIEWTQFQQRGRVGWDRRGRWMRPRTWPGAWQRGWAHRSGYGASWGWGWRPWGWTQRPWAWSVHYTPWGWRGRIWW